MAVETEIKLRLPGGPEQARALLEHNGFQVTIPRELETNQTFDAFKGDRPIGELRQGDRLLRLRSASGRWLVTYKGPTEGPPEGANHKRREEIETEVSDGPAFAQILAALGYRPSFAYEKFRTTFRVPGEEGIVTLDETPIGDFLELEGRAWWIDKTAERLGFQPSDYVLSSYAALYEAHRDEAHRADKTVPRDMKFHPP